MKRCMKCGLLKPVTDFHGHEYTPETTYVDKRGCRTCRACRRAQKAARDAKRRLK